jgi:DNA-binding CsgD family transcriptional regulator/DNA polymerase III delta prime subunit
MAPPDPPAGALGGPNRRVADAVAQQWPLAGRRDELREMVRLFDTGGHGLILAGPAGVGKTRLALELLGRVEANGSCTVRVIGTRAASGIPLGAFASVLPPPSRGHGAGVDDRAYHLGLCAQHLVAAAAGSKLAILVDDAHLLDDASATLVHQLATYAKAFVVITVRSDEPCSDPILALWKDDTLRRMEVGILSYPEMEEVLHAALGPSIDRGAVHRLATASGGNVLFLRELVLGALADGTLRFERGIWRLVGTFSPSSRLTEMVEARLSGFTPDERLLVELLAVGEPLGATELQQFGNPASAEDLERRGFLVTRMDGTRLLVRLAHPMYADVLKAKMPALRRRELARLLVGIADATGGTPGEDVLRLATWRLEAGGPQDPDLLFEAATIARWRYDFALAERLAVAAREAGAGFEASLLAAQLISLQGRGQDAERLLAELVDSATTDRQRGLVACARLDNDVFHLGRIERGLAMAEAAEQQISDPEWRDNLTARRGAVATGTFGPKAHAPFATLHERATGGAFVYASIIAANCIARGGRLTEARLIAERAFEAQSKLTEHFDWYPWTHLFFRNEALAHEGRIDEAISVAETQYRQGLQEGSPEQQAWFAWQLCKLSPDRGHFRSATQYGREAVTLFHQLGWPLFEHFALIHLAIAHALVGDATSAAEALRRDEALELPKDCYWPVDRELADAWIATANGDLREAARRFSRAAAIGDDIGDRLGQSVALHALARIGQATTAAKGLSDLIRHIEGDLVLGRAAHARALQTGDAEALEAVAERFEAMGATVLAAEAAADAAVLWRKDREPRRAARLETRAMSLAKACEDPATPALQAVSGRAELTRAERETALLAIRGRSNKEIAAQLEISIRTVENHLQRSYQKLGISGRSELAAGLGAMPEDP